MVCALIAAAEESGNLGGVVNEIADYLEGRDRLMRKVIAALTYPAFVCVFFLLVLAVATFWIIPQFQEVYSDFGTRLPLFTRLVFSVNDFVLRAMPLLVLSAVSGIVALVLWVRKPAGRRAFDGFLLRLPIFGRLVLQAGVARFCRSLEVLLNGGVAISRALEMAKDTTGNRILAEAVVSAREEILQGGRLAPSFRRQEIFPRMFVRLVSTGEETGNLSSLLRKAADYYEERVDAALTGINALIEPVIIIVIGAFVLVFVLALYLPIFSLATKMK
jgi:type IV pilus assembly protein PilC